MMKPHHAERDDYVGRPKSPHQMRCGTHWNSMPSWLSTDETPRRAFPAETAAGPIEAVERARKFLLHSAHICR